MVDDPFAQQWFKDNPKLMLFTTGVPSAEHVQQIQKIYPTPTQFTSSKKWLSKPSDINSLMTTTMLQEYQTWHSNRLQT